MSTLRAAGAAVLLVGGLLGVADPAAAASEPVHATTRVSGETGRAEANNASFTPAVSRDGRWVAFASAASNLVPGDTNNRRDVFLRDSANGSTTRISVSSRGRQGNLDSYSPSISDDGRYIVFDSFASNLVPGDRGRDGDVFLHDRDARTTTRVSVGPGGAEADADSGFATISGDGNVIAFESTATNLRAGSPGRLTDLYVTDRTGATLDWVSTSMFGGEANGGGGELSLSRDGQVVAFTSTASNLVAGDTNLTDDVFVRDRALGTTTRVSVTSLGGEGNAGSGAPSLSDDGRVVAFASNAANLNSWDPTGQTAPRFLLGIFEGGDENFATDVFAHDTRTGRTELASVATSGGQGSAESYEPSISGDGRFVAFSSLAPELVEGDTNRSGEVFVRDLTSRQTTRVSVGTDGRQGNGMSLQPALSGDGTRVAFVSDASNLVRGDRNREGDVFVRQ